MIIPELFLYKVNQGGKMMVFQDKEYRVSEDIFWIQRKARMPVKSYIVTLKKKP